MSIPRVHLPFDPENAFERASRPIFFTRASFAPLKGYLKKAPQYCLRRSSSPAAFDAFMKYLSFQVRAPQVRILSSGRASWHTIIPSPPPLYARNY